MRLYFSGVAGASEREMLIEAGVTDVLVDQFDMKNAEGFPTVALDSGAYRVFKKGGALDVSAYQEIVASRSWAMAIAPDVIGDAEATYHNWTLVRNDPCIIPVWHWSDDTYLLDRYLDERKIVGIGGLVTLMRTKDEKMLTALKALCEKYPQRFHIFGINWLRSIKDLKGLVYSGDTSKWLDGGRYGHGMFVHTGTGNIQQASAKILATFDPRWADFDRKQRNIECAKVLKDFCAS